MADCIENVPLEMHERDTELLPVSTIKINSAEKAILKINFRNGFGSYRVLS